MKGLRSFSKKVASKEKSSKDVCMDRINQSESALRCWKAHADAHKTYNELQKRIAEAIKEFVSTHSEDVVEKQQKTASDGEQKQEQDSEKKLQNVMKNKKNLNVHAQASTSTGDNSETRGLEQALKDFEEQFKNTVDVCTLLEMDTDDQTQTTKGNKLLRSFSFRISSLPWSRSSKVRNLPSAETDKKHSSTLKYLGAWEKQLYHLVEKLHEEEKIGRVHEQNVAKQGAVWAINQIRQLRDQEIWTHLVELLRRLTRSWEQISECYATQGMLLKEIGKSLFKPPPTMSCDNPHLDAAEKLKEELEKFHAGFINYVSSQKEYVKALHDWASHPLPLVRDENHNNVVVLLESWSTGLAKLYKEMTETKTDKKTVIKAMEALTKKVGDLVESQNTEYGYKIQVDRHKREYRKTKHKCDKLKGRIETEKRKFEVSRTMTQTIAVELVQTDFSALFEFLAESSRTVANKYGEIGRDNNASSAEVR